MTKPTLRNLLLDSRDGEWGNADPGPDRRLMAVIRGTDFPAVRVGDVANVPKRYLEERHAIRKRVQPWDILIETAGGSPDRPTGRTLLLKPSLFESLGPDITCASFARFLRIDETRADSHFIFWLLQYHYGNRDLLQFHTQHTGVARFQFTTFAETFPLTLPDRSVQERIASILGTYDDLIEVNRRRISVLEEMARRLFTEWITHERLPTNESIPFTEISLGEIAEVSWGDTKTTKQAYVPAGYTAYSATGPDGFLDHFDHVGPGIVVSAIGAQCGKSWLADGHWSCIKNTIYVKGIPGKSETRVLALALSDPKKWPRRGAAQPFISQTDARRVSLRLPPFQWQERLNKLIAPLQLQSQTLQRASFLLSQSRDLLLPRLLSGELPVAVAERELETAA